MGPEVAWGAAVVFVSVAPFLAILASGHDIVGFDSARLFAPMRGLIVDALRVGRLPLWNPHEGTGMPLFAQAMHGVLHPWSILAALVAPVDGVSLMILLHEGTGALGAAVLARTLGVSRTGSAVAGIVYGLSGYLLSMSRVITFLAGAGTAPWAIAALAAVARPGRWRLSLAAAAVGVLHLAGDPQWSLVAMGLGTALAWVGGGRGAAGKAMLGAFAGTMVASVQLVPAWAFYARSARSIGPGATDQFQWALAPARLLEFVAPGFFAGRPGNLDAPVFQWLGGPSRYPIPFVLSVTLGSAAIFLAAWGSTVSRTGKLLAVAAVVFLWMALGHHLGATEALEWIPVWRGIRYAEKMVGPFSLVIALLAGLGADRVRRGESRSIPRATVICAGAAGTTALVASIASGASGPKGVAEGTWALAAARLSVGMAIGAGGLAFLAAVLLGGRRWPMTRVWTGTAIVLVVVAQGIAAVPFALHPGEPGLREALPLRWLHDATPVPRVLVPLEGGALWLPDGLDEVDGALLVQSRMGLASFNAASRVDQINTYTGVEPARVVAIFRGLMALGPGQLVALRRFAVSHVVLPDRSMPGEESIRATAVAGGHRVGVDRSARLEVWSIPHRPWAWFAEGVRIVGSEAEVVPALVDLESRGDRAVALVEPGPIRLGTGRVHAVERRADSIWVDAEAREEGLLVVADAEWPGWEATIDGLPVEILLADGLVRAVRWPAGRHRLDMRYRPREVQVGIWMSCAGVLVLIALAARRERPAEHQANGSGVPVVRRRQKARNHDI